MGAEERAVGRVIRLERTPTGAQPSRLLFSNSRFALIASETLALQSSIRLLGIRRARERIFDLLLSVAAFRFALSIVLLEQF